MVDDPREVVKNSMSPKERVWLATLPKVFFNATKAAEHAGYKWPDKIGAKLKAKFANEIEELIQEQIMGSDEAAQRMASAAKFNLSDYLITEGRSTRLDLEKLKTDGYGWMVKGLKYTSKGGAIFEFWDSQRALEKIFDNVNPSLGDKERPFIIKVIETDD